MVKRAYSLELGKPISAETAHKKSLYGELMESRAFKCADNECNINLTCTNWREKSAKRIYFTPTSKSTLHIAGCNESGEDEEKQRSNFETENAKTSVNKNGTVKLKKISEQKTVKHYLENTETKYNNNLSHRPKNNSYGTKGKNEGSYITSIISLIEMFRDYSFDNHKRFLKISSIKTLSLNEFFVNVDQVSHLPFNKIRIFYGKVKVQTFNDTGLKILFINSKITPPLFTNKKIMFKRYYGKDAKKFVDTNKELYAFFRGYLTEENKWKPFNNEFFKDIYFSINSI
ncbi:hypothetical protein ACFSTA_18790 [Ornithinibacillus salinisoli]|uniref:Uncharacterized protein n=1 Tax=Ornithinibacillus salinisoli TaxID=1848459 RepID=A0ABW4W5J9_9BACI